MRTKLLSSIALMGIFLVGLAACGEGSFGDADNTTSRGQAVTVVPEFSVTGTSTLPEELYLSELGLAISEIRLEPLSSDVASVAYSSRHAIDLHFDVARGELQKEGAPLQLPQAGRYMVSVRLDPSVSTEEASEGIAETVSPSLSLAGFVAGESIVRIDPRYDEKRSDGSPVPMPFDENEDDDTEIQDAPALPLEWTPFRYDSQRSVFFTLGEVELDAGEQTLSFDFDVEDWALELVDPLVSAVTHRDDPTASDEEEGVDVTRPLESTGHGPEAFFQSASVRTGR
jgi:hypothetical protein